MLLRNVPWQIDWIALLVAGYEKPRVHCTCTMGKLLDHGG
jgi:hypothetical protein